MSEFKPIRTSTTLQLKSPGRSSLNHFSSSLIDVEVTSVDECEEKLRGLFDKALLVFLESEGISYRHFPVILDDDKKVDLFNLFVLVMERGGSDSVTKEGLWELVAEELGLGTLVSPSLKLIYCKYMNRMEKWAVESSRIVIWDNQEYKKKGCYGVMLHGLGEGFKGLLENGTCQKRNHDLVVDFSHSKDSGSEFHRSMKRSRESSHLDGERLEVSCVVLGDDAVVSTKVEGLDPDLSKRELSKMLKWLTLAATSPGDPSIGVIPHHSTWKKYLGNQSWIRLVRARNALIVQREYPPFDILSNHGGQRMHPSKYPSMYNDGGYNAAEDITEPYQTVMELRLEEDGPKNQAQVDEWTGPSSPSDTRWLGTRIWPLENEESLDETFGDDLVGKGRPDNYSCCCFIPNDVECLRLHIAEKRMELKRELGDAFFKWGFNEMGEEVSLRWTRNEEEMFKDMMSEDPTNFWKNAARRFKGKKKEQLVSYYFNVFMINKIRYLGHISSDDEAPFGSIGRRFGDDAVTSYDTDTMICSQNRQCDTVDR